MAQKINAMKAFQCKQQYRSNRLYYACHIPPNSSNNLHSCQGLCMEYFLEQNRCVIQTSLNIYNWIQKLVPKRKQEKQLKKMRNHPEGKKNRNGNIKWVSLLETMISIIGKLGICFKKKNRLQPHRQVSSQNSLKKNNPTLYEAENYKLLKQ